MRTDEELLAEWYAARGKSASRLPALEVPRIVHALRLREEETLNPKPLLKCPVCMVITRGPHNGLTPPKA